MISFDLDGTLLDSSFVDSVWLEAIPALYAKHKVIDFHLAKQIVTREYDKVGDEKVEWYDIEYWLEHFNLHLDPRQLIYSCRHNIVVYPEAWSVIENLSTDNRLIIISNAAREFIEIEIGELESSFAEIFSSVSDFHQTKKEADLYLRVCHSLKIRPEELYHVGDNYVFDYLVPREVGINAFYLDRDGQRTGKHMVRNLKEFEEKIKYLHEEGLNKGVRNE